MPRLPEPRTPALQELARQLRFQPADASRRQLVRAEELSLQLLSEYDPQREWPVEWVVFRVTGYRTDNAETSLTGTIGGSELQRDLGALVQILSAASGESESSLREEEPSGWLTVDELCERWHISRQTLDRYRGMGLISRRVSVPRTAGIRTPPQRAMFSLHAVRAFEKTHKKLLEHAAGFSRTDASAGTRMYRRAVRLHAKFGWTLAKIARTLAPRFERSVGAVRRAILDADAGSGSPVFAKRPGLRASGRSEVVQGFKEGGRARDLANSAGRSRASVYRMVASERAMRLRALRVAVLARPEFTDERSAAKILETSHASAGLGRQLPHTVAELLEQAEATEPAAARERALGSAFALLRFQAATTIAAMGKSPTILGRGVVTEGKRSAAARDSGIDWVETRLRWASRIKAELVRSQFGLLLRTVESQLGRPLTEFSGAIAVDLVGALAAAIFEAADRHDPFKGGRLAAPAGIAMNRAAAKWAEDHPRELAPMPARPLARAAPSHARIEHIWTALTPWSTWLEPAPGVRERIESINVRERNVLIVRLGWDARPPRTVAEAAKELSMTTQAVIRAERAAVGQLR